MYSWIVFLHVAGGFGFVLAHGASAAVAFALRRERNLERLRALLELSRSTFSLMYASLLLLLIAGIVAGFMGQHWGRGWIWAAIVALVAISAAMGIMGGAYYGQLHRAAGLPYVERGKPHPAEEPANAAEIDQLLAKGNPVLLTVIGAGGLVFILWLMMFKPF